MPARTVEVKILGDASSAKRALAETAAAAEASGGRLEHAAQGAGGAFEKLGSKMSAMGLPFGQAVSDMGSKFSELETKSGKFSAVLQEIGKVSLLAGAALGAGIGVEAFKLGTEFQEATASLASHAQIPIKAAQAIGSAFLSTAGQTTFSAQEMMAAFAPVSGEFETLYGHALSAGASLTVMKAASDLAEASGSALADTTKAVADAMLVYHLKVGQAATASDVLFNTARGLGVSVSDLGTSLVRLEPRIVGSGMSLQQTGGFMLELGKAAGSGRQAMRLAGTAIQAMVTPTTAAQKALGEMGITLTDSNGHFIGMQAAIGRLHDAFAKLPADTAALAAGQSLVAAQTQLATMKTETQTPALKAAEKALTAHVGVLKLQASQLSTNSAMQAIFGRNANIMAAIVAGGVPAFEQATKAAGKLGTAQAGAKDMASTFAGQMRTLKSTMEDLGTRIGVVLVPIVQRLGEEVAKVTGFFIKHKAIAEAVGIVLGVVLVAAVGAYTVSMATAAAATVAATWPILAIIAGVAALGVGIGILATHWKQVWHDVKAWFLDAYHFIDDGLHKIPGPILAIVSPVLFLATRWKEIWGDIKTVITDAGNVIKTVIHDIEAAIHHVTGAISGVMGAIGKVTGAVSGVAKGIGGVLSHIPGLAVGGFVSAPTLAMVGEKEPEFVIPASLVNRGAVAPLPAAVASMGMGGLSGGAMGASGAVGGSAGAGVSLVYSPHIEISGTPQQIVGMVEAKLDQHAQDLARLLAA